MTRILWDTFFLISGSLFTLGGAGQSNSTILEANFSVITNSTVGQHSSKRSSTAISSSNTTTETTANTMAKVLSVKSSVFILGARHGNATTIQAKIFISRNSTAAPNTSTSSSASIIDRNTTSEIFETATKSIQTVKKFVAAAVRSHFGDCPDTHQHFCFHGTCRFLILEETPACVCHPGFVGMRCEHADLLAIVATNHRQQTAATVLVLCVIGCVLIMVLCTLLHCWWRQDCRRRRQAHLYILQKHGASCYPPESVV
ncbi:protransforming growth factor alpha [Antennarius striatus]|uniref:protransforming growth factor alpha n=1 Tax=Antennarius striatus TaxID=241820 RepID=UPI0035B44C17